MSRLKRTSVTPTWARKTSQGHTNPPAVLIWGPRSGENGRVGRLRTGGIAERAAGRTTARHCPTLGASRGAAASEQGEQRARVERASPAAPGTITCSALNWPPEEQTHTTGGRHLSTGRKSSHTRSATAVMRAQAARAFPRCVRPALAAQPRPPPYCARQGRAGPLASAPGR